MSLAASPSTARSSESDVSATGRHGETRARQSASAFHVPDPGDETLVEEDVTAATARETEARDHPIEIRRSRQDVGPEPPHRALVQLEHRAAPQHRLSSAPTQHEPGPSTRDRAASTHGPPSGHHR